MIIETCRENKMKILCPDLDIYIPLDSKDLSVGYIVIIYDGWAPPDLTDI